MQLKGNKTDNNDIDTEKGNLEQKNLDALVETQIGVNNTLDVVVKEFSIDNQPLFILYLERKIIFKGQEIALSPKQFTLFTILLENKNTPCSTQDICESLRIENAESVLTLIGHLRRKITKFGIDISTYWWESAYILLDNSGMTDKVEYLGHILIFSQIHNTVQVDDGEPIQFFKGDFQLFKYLLKRNGYVCSRQEIEEKLSLKASTIKVLISRIRKNISAYPSLQIQLHFKAGYSMQKDENMKEISQKRSDVLLFSQKYLYNQLIQSSVYEGAIFKELEICDSLYTISRDSINRVAFSKEEFSIFLILAIHYHEGISIEKMRNKYFKREANRTTDIPLRELVMKLKILKILVEKKGDNFVLRF